MGILNQVTGILQKYVGGSGAPGSPNEIAQHFDQVAGAVPQGSVAEGLAAAFRSDQTPPFGQMLGGLFGQSNSDQKAGVLNQLISSAGPGALAALGSGGLASLLQGGARQITPAQAANISPEEVQKLASHAENQDPSIIDKASQFYSAHPTLIKTLGGAAMAIAMAKVAQRQSNA